MKTLTNMQLIILNQKLITYTHTNERERTKFLVDMQTTLATIDIEQQVARIVGEHNEH